MLTAPTTPATVTLADGKERVLRYSLRAMRDVNARYPDLKMPGDPAISAFADLEGLAFIVAKGLAHQFEGGDPTITEEQVLDLIEAHARNYVLQQVLLAFGASQAALEDFEKNLEALSPQPPPTPPLSVN